MTLGSGTTAQSCTGTTNAAGNASCVIANVNQTSGTAPIAVAFAGDAYYRAASGPGSAIVAGVADTGGFVIGDLSAKTPPAPMHPYTSLSNGTQVNFWGSQTWKTNQFSGVNNAPASMKGYVDNAPANLGLTGTSAAARHGRRTRATARDRRRPFRTTWSSSSRARSPSQVPLSPATSRMWSSSRSSRATVRRLGTPEWGPIVAWLC